MTEFDLETVDTLLTTTRAVRKRLDFTRPVKKELIMECIGISQQAPTAHNSQSWRWIVVDDPELKNALAEDFRYPMDIIEKMSKEAETDQDVRFWGSVDYLTANIEKAPYLVIPCLQVTEEARNLEGPATVYGSIFPAIWNFQLALRSRGLGSCLTTQHLLRRENSDRLLGLPDDVEQVALIPVAYTKGTDFKPAKRLPPESITSFNGWNLI